jgi:hypothetical protein
MHGAGTALVMTAEAFHTATYKPEYIIFQDIPQEAGRLNLRLEDNSNSYCIGIIRNYIKTNPSFILPFGKGEEISLPSFTSKSSFRCNIIFKYYFKV